MFCPRCAAQNLDDAKFCRGCGTSLETVALALADNYQPSKRDGRLAKNPFESWLETRKDAVNKLSKGTGWLVSSLLIGAALGLFSNTRLDHHLDVHGRMDGGCGSYFDSDRYSCFDGVEVYATSTRTSSCCRSCAGSTFDVE